MSSSRSAGPGGSTSSLTPTGHSTSLDGGLLMRPIIALISIRVEITVWTLIQTGITVWTVIQESAATSASAQARVIDTYGGLGVLPALTSPQRHDQRNQGESRCTNSPIPILINPSPRTHPGADLLNLERNLMATRVTRHASTMSALLTSVGTGRLMTVKDANANPVVPSDGRSGGCGGRGGVFAGGGSGTGGRIGG